MFLFFAGVFRFLKHPPLARPMGCSAHQAGRFGAADSRSVVWFREKAAALNAESSYTPSAAHIWIPLLSWIGFVTATVVLAMLLSLPASAPAAEDAAAKTSSSKSASPNPAKSSAAPRAGDSAERGSLPPLPQPVTSFAAAAVEGTIYIYGGHIGVAHDYHRDTQIDTFAKLDLKSPRQWHPLPAGPAIQGLAMIADRGVIYRVGGMQARNLEGEKESLHSLADVAAFDPAAGRWRELPPIPAPISSHEVAVHRGKLYVLGGWTLDGKSRDARWAEHGWVMDLSNSAAGWKSLADQGFKRRAVAAAATSKHIYVMGGLTEKGVSTRVDIFDPETGAWSQGPELPLNDRMRGFGGVAIAIADDVFFSGYSGRIWRLTEGDAQWTDTGYDLKTPRFFHRIVESGGKLILLGGADKAGATANVQTVDVQTLLARPTGLIPSVRQFPADPAAGSSRWPGFLGLNHAQTSARNLPLEWSDQKGVAWKLDLAGVGQSSPVIHDGRVYATSIDQAASQLVISAAELAGGKLLWRKSIATSLLRPESDYISKAAPTPLVDELGVYAFFETGELVALSHEGDIRWSRSLTGDYGPIQGNHGLGSSPTMNADSIFLLVEHDGPSYLAALDKKSGSTRWKTDRPARVSWSSPQIDGSQILISSSGALQGFDIADGRLLWQLEGIAGNTVASPLVTERWIVNPSGDAGNNFALHRGKLGGGPAPKAEWTAAKATAGFASPVVCGSMVYFINKAGVLFGVGLDDGQMRWAVRLQASAWATPIVAGRRLYVFNTDGSAVVMEGDSDEPRKLAENRLTLPEKSRVYGAAAVDGCFVLRLDRRLICIR